MLLQRGQRQLSKLVGQARQPSGSGTKWAHGSDALAPGGASGGGAFASHDSSSHDRSSSLVWWQQTPPGNFISRMKLSFVGKSKPSLDLGGRPSPSLDLSSRLHAQTSDQEPASKDAVSDGPGGASDLLPAPVAPPAAPADPTNAWEVLGSARPQVAPGSRLNRPALPALSEACERSSLPKHAGLVMRAASPVLPVAPMPDQSFDEQDDGTGTPPSPLVQPAAGKPAARPARPAEHRSPFLLDSAAPQPHARTAAQAALLVGPPSSGRDSSNTTPTTPRASGKLSASAPATGG